MDPITAGTTAGFIQLASEVAGKLKTGINSVDHYASYFKNSSLIDVSQVARVEPIVMIDASCMNWENLTDVTQSLQAIFSGYYLQAVNMLATVGGVSVASKLAPLNPNRSWSQESHTDWRMSTESYKHRLPTTHNKLAMSLESNDSGVAKNTFGVGDKELATVKDLANLSVGKLYSVKIVENGLTATIPVSIRLMVSTMPTNSMVNMFTLKSGFDMDMKERYHSWKAGRLEFFRDLILCKDLIDKQRTALMKDKNGLYSQIIKRENNNLKSGLINQNRSLATSSNMAIISTDTLASIEQVLYGKLSNFKIRQNVFDNTNLMIMAVVDMQSDMCTFYYRGIQEKNEVSIKDMKVSNKGSGPDVADMMKSFMAGGSVNI
jgi:hypothetical protein